MRRSTAQSGNPVPAGTGSQCSARAHYPGAVACFAQNELGGARLKTRAIF